mmetsp:Transcript_24707/g.68917  ORF Transcript_24707/g.68917 Transcript_24707/m.68917 type:complete len:721 (-) Transcript_24707:35-2197(-)
MAADDAYGEGLTKRRVAKARETVTKSTVAQSVTLLERVHVEEVLRKSLSDRRGCKTLTVSFLFFVFYVSFSTALLDTSSRYLAESPFREALLPALDEVLDIDDVWRFMFDTYIPLFFKQTNSYGEAPDEKDWGRVFTYSKVRGAFILEQSRSVAEPCKYDFIGNKMCHPHTSYSTADFGLNVGQDFLDVLDHAREGFRAVGSEGEGSERRLRLMRDELNQGIWIPQPAATDSMFQFYLYANHPLNKTLRRMEHLKKNGWLDKQTSYLQVQAVVVNAEEGPPKLTLVIVKFHFSRGGGVFAKLRCHTVSLRPQSDVVVLVSFFAYCLIAVLDLVLCVSGFAGAFRKKSVCAHLRNEAFFVFGLVLTFMIIAGFAFQVSQTQTFNESFKLFESAKTDSEVKSVSEDIGSETYALVAMVAYYELLLTYYGLFSMCRLFGSLEFQPRLGIVIKTLKATTVDLFHFGIIFIPTFIAYAIAGMCIFGRRVDHFSSLPRSIGTCFKIAIETEFDWDTLSEEHFWTATIWVWTFVMLICLIMLNMVLAIIMDVYTEVRHASDNEETFMEGLLFGLDSLWSGLCGQKFVPAERVLQELEDMDQVFTCNQFAEAVPEMMVQQRTRILNAAKQRQDAQLRQSALPKNIGGDVPASIKLGVEQVLKLIPDWKALSKTTIEGDTRSDAMCTEDIIQSIAIQNHWMASVQSQLDKLRSDVLGVDFNAAQSPGVL